jgi:hypothetical protein
MLRLTGATQRQVDYWTRQGWIHGSRPGSGKPRAWPVEEMTVAQLMVRLINAGFDPGRAVWLARSVLPVAGGRTEVVLGPGLRLGIAPGVVDVAVDGGVL